MAGRKYFSTRERLQTPLLLGTMRDLFIAIYRNYLEDGYFQQSFGATCSTGAFSPGTLGGEIARQVFIRLRKNNLWPILDYYRNYSESDFFDVLELLYDHVAKPDITATHSPTCRKHYTRFDAITGRDEFRSSINEILQDYSSGFELSLEGYVLRLPAAGMEALEQENLSSIDPKNIEERIRKAVVVFRRQAATADDQREAVRILADVLEFLRPNLKQVLMKQDESDLFNIVNNFGIRHHNTEQKTDYDTDVWLPWMFYHSLATIHAALKLLGRRTAVEGG